MYDLQTHRIIHSRNVIFEEENFEEIKRNSGSENDVEDKIDSASDESIEVSNEVNEQNEQFEEVSNLRNERPKRIEKLPVRLEDYDVNFSCLALPSELSEAPCSFEEALDSINSENWEIAINDEIKA